MITYNRKFVKIVEYWFDEDCKAVNSDVVRYIQRSSPVIGIQQKDFYTILVDLEKKTDDLFSVMEKDTRYEIRRASEKDDLIYEYCATRQWEIVDNFVFFYNNFALKKGIPKIDSRRLKDYALNNRLIISKVRSIKIVHKYGTFITVISIDRVYCFPLLTLEIVQIVPFVVIWDEPIVFTIGKIC